MKNRSETKKQRFESLLDSYAIAAYLSERLLDSGLLERKVKVGSSVNRADEILSVLTPIFAYDIRVANSIIQHLKDPSFAEGDFFTSSINIANAYFDELKTRGAKWDYSDLEDLFIEYRQRAESEMELERNRW